MQIDAITIITRALRRIGAVASGETPTAAETSDALGLLNELIDAWRLERLLLPTRARATYSLLAGTGTYTIGPTGTFIGERPLDIDAASYLPAGETWERPLAVISHDRYAEESRKDAPGWPEDLRYEPGAVLGTITLLPVPREAGTLALYYKTTLTTFADTSTLYDLREGYVRALRLNLALACAEEFGRPVSEELRDSALDAKAWIKRQNEADDIPTLSVDSALLNCARFDIRTGGF